MKLTILAALIIFFNDFIFAQSIPIEKINSEWKEDSIFLPFKADLKEFDEFLIYYNGSSWTKNTLYFVLGKKNTKWRAFNYEIKYKGEFYPDQKEFKIEKKSTKVKTSEITNFFFFLDSTNFWNLSQDSLDNNRSLFITDGSFDMIILHAQNNSFAVSAYMVEYYFESFKDAHRKIFIQNKNKLICLFRKKRYKCK
ncbi:MAG: hypothetical protein ACK5B9_01655 [Flavobacteriia bacterium]